METMAETREVLKIFLCDKMLPGTGFGTLGSATGSARKEWLPGARCADTELLASTK